MFKIGTSLLDTSDAPDERASVDLGARRSINNHDLFLSNAEVRRVIRRSIDTSAA